ncbi:MAG: hypothetical protein JWN37_654 [Candidatus Nomurabacteria bacterium]|nr:hypothetical protein [Candidatus Nomurabacteria bacterium]
MYGLTDKEISILKKLDIPQKIQDFLDRIPYNHELKGETCMSPKRVLEERRAHCIEAAMFASIALMLQGRPPLVLSLKVTSADDDYHAVALFKENGYWGAISKTNHAVLRYRDPIYKTIRELALSYFHEYYLGSSGQKTLRGYTRPINLKKFGTKWVSEEMDLWKIAESIYVTKHIDIIPKGNEKLIRNATPFERKVTNVEEWLRNENINQMIK